LNYDTCTRTGECVKASLSENKTLDVATTAGSWPQVVINKRSYLYRKKKRKAKLFITNKWKCRTFELHRQSWYYNFNISL